MEEYCNYCGDDDETHILMQLRNGLTICKTCAEHEHVCVTCGSTRRCWEPAYSQPHFSKGCK